jgi:soluble lytic murein transglycosylase-like protein
MSVMSETVSATNNLAPSFGGPPHARLSSAPPFAAAQSNFGQTAYRRASVPNATSGMPAAQASAAGVPPSLVERVIARESGGNPRAVHAGNYGLMQIRLGTVRAMGYTGSAAGLLDPQTNMTYAVRYLAGAYRVAGGNEDRAIALYARGYYYEAKAQGFSPYARGGSSYGFGTTPSASPLAPVGFFQSNEPAADGYRVRHHRRHAV